MYGNSICGGGLRNNKWCLLILILIVVWILVFIRRCGTIRLYSYQENSILASTFGGAFDIPASAIGGAFDIPASAIGGAFDIHKFIEGLRKKYTDPQDHIEIELKLKDKSAYSKFAKWAKSQPDKTIEDSTNKIWTNGRENVIETIYNNGKSSKWSTKQRLSKYEIELGPIAISLEKDIEGPPNFIAEKSKPNMVRQKSRVSANINEHWRVDCTKVRQSDTGEKEEVEIEYIAPDYWNALNHIDEVDQFIRSI